MSDPREKQKVLEYLKSYQEHLIPTDVADQLSDLKARFEKVRSDKKKIIIAGNGGSAAIASHCAVDLTKNAGVRCVSFNEASLITCLANDYGYAHWLRKGLEFYADEADLVVLISSSGRSENMLQAGRYAIEKGLDLVTLTGFDPGNPLRQLGSLNFWVDSRAYNLVEMVHHIWILTVCDLMIGTMEYPAS
jgi:D-sedoheptulose 7-phosphate isomerase